MGGIAKLSDRLTEDVQVKTLLSVIGSRSLYLPPTRSQTRTFKNWTPLRKMSTSVLKFTFKFSYIIIANMHIKLDFLGHH